MSEEKKNPLLEREFILAVLALIGGVVLFVIGEKEYAITLVSFAIGGYTVSRGLAKIGSGAKILFLMAVPLLLLAGCCKGHIRADAIDGSIEIVTERHDRLVNATKDVNGDGVTDDEDEADRKTYLRTTKLLRKVVDAALDD